MSEKYIFGNGVAENEEGDIVSQYDVESENGFDPDEHVIGWLGDQDPFMRMASRRAIQEISDDEPIESTYGPDFTDIVATIESGIEESRRGGYATKVMDGDGNRIPLGRYLAVDVFKAQLSPAGVNVILDRYIKKDNPKESKPITSPIMVSNRHTFKDSRSAAANDFDESDDEEA